MRLTVLAEEEDIMLRELHAGIRTLHDEIRHFREEIASLRNMRKHGAFQPA